MAVTEQPRGPGVGAWLYGKLFHNYIWRSIFRSGYPNTPRNQMLVVATNVFLHLHPTRLHKTHVRITHTYCLGGLTFFFFLGLTVTGVILLVLTLGLSFTGYLLPWDQLAIWAVTVGMNMAGTAPVLGDDARLVLLGGLEVSDPALLRFYTLHVIGLPLIAAIFMAVHFWRIRRDGGLARPL